MAKETKLQIIVDADNRSERAFAAVGSSLQSMSSTMKNVGTVGGVAFAGLSFALLQTVEAAADAQKVDAQLEAVLKSTSHAAGLLTEDLKAQADALSKLTTFDDDAVKSTQALLLTFTSIKGAVFNEAIPTIMDMSVALGQDLKSSAIQVGKALQDPINGITALSRVGVNFSDAQKEVITNLVETGKVAEAQRLILKELNVEFGGSAQAQAETYAGRLQQLKNRYSELQEAIGVALIPVLISLLEVVGPIIEKTLAWAEANPGLAKAVLLVTLGLTALLAIMLPIALMLPGLAIMFGALTVSLVGVAAVAAPLVLGIMAIIAILGAMKLMGLDTKEAWDAVWLGIKLIAADAANAVIRTVEGMVNFVLTGVNNAIKAINRVIALAQKVPGFGKGISKIGEVKADFGELNTDTIAAKDLAGRGGSAWDTAKPFVNMAGSVFLSADVAEKIGDLIMGKFKLSNQM